MKKLTSLFIITLSFLLTMSAQGQERYQTTYGVYGFPIGISELEHTESLTASQKDSVENVKDKLDKLSVGFIALCEEFNINAWAFSDFHPYKGVSAAKSDLLNDKLAWDRLRKVLRYKIDINGVPEDCFQLGQPVYADSQVRGVKFKIIPKQLPTAGGVDKGVIAEINDKISALEIGLDQLREDVEEKNEEQDKQIADNKSGIDDIERRVSDLEKDRGIGFSGHIGLGGQYFASQLVPSAEIGLDVGQFEFTGFIGYLPWLTADLDEGPTDYTRSQVGWSATWYALSYEDLRVGPMIGFQWARDDIDAIDCEIVYQSPLAGVAADITLNKRFSLYGNVAYAPTSIHVTGGLEKDVSDVQIRAGIRLNL